MKFDRVELVILITAILAFVYVFAHVVRFAFS